MLNLSDIFAHEGVRARIDALLDAPRGIVAISGGEMSGKTTALLALARELKQRGRRCTYVCTDPEIPRLPRFADLSGFEPGDVLMVSDRERELRPALDEAASRGIVMAEIEQSTARAVVDLANDGATVLSQIHTAHVGLDCAYTLDKMGIEADEFLRVFSCLASQMLLPRLCPHCRAPLTLGLAEAQQADPSATAPMQVWREVGCERCGPGGNYTGPPGTHNRMSLHEVLIVDDDTRPVFARYLEEGNLHNPMPDGHVNLPDVARLLLRRGDIGYETYRREITQNPILRLQHQWELERRRGADAQERLARLRRFFSPAVAELIVSGAIDDPMKSRRREIVVVFLDLRGFTSFAETSDPEDVMRVLREYHAAMGELISRQSATLERFAGDGMMIFLNDPMPVENPAVDAVTMAVKMQQQFHELRRGWRKLGLDIGLGIGIAQGYATIGAIGYEDRRDYGAIGVVCNLGARLCSEAADGQILVSQRVQGAVEDSIATEPVGPLALKGFHSPVQAHSVKWQA
jgi:class 3 adenylate cyclase